MSVTDDALHLLNELAELGMDVVRRSHQAAMAAEDPDQVAALTTAFCDASRGLRQTIALHLRIQSGSFFVQRPTPVPARDPAPDTGTAPKERLEDAYRLESSDWNERPDYEPRIRLTGDEAQDAEIIREAVEASVTRIRKTYARAEAALAPRPERRRSGRAALLCGSAIPSADSS